MEKPKIDYVGRVTLKSIRDYILDHKLSDRDAIALNPKNYDDIVLEFRDYYKDSLKAPYFMFDTLIEEDRQQLVPLDRIGLTTNKENLKPENKRHLTLDKNEKVYRCGWCGNIVDSDGNELSVDTFRQKAQILETFRNEAYVEKVTGYCCRNKQH